MAKIIPSLLSADFSGLKKEIGEIEKCKGVGALHLDVMDGNFVKNITFGPPLVASVRKVTKLLLDTHLMINDPSFYVKPFADAGSDIITFHLERAQGKKAFDIIKKIKKENKKAGISVNPDFDYKKIKPYLKDIDLILFMSVFPGFGGQKFISSALDGVRLAAEIKKEKGLDFIIEIDGGINSQTAREAYNAGAEWLVAGNAVFGQTNRAAAVNAILKKLL